MLQDSLTLRAGVDGVLLADFHFATAALALLGGLGVHRLCVQDFMECCRLFFHYADTGRRRRTGMITLCPGVFPG